VQCRVKLSMSCMYIPAIIIELVDIGIAKVKQRVFITVEYGTHYDRVLPVLWNSLHFSNFSTTIIFCRMIYARRSNEIRINTSINASSLVLSNFSNSRNSLMYCNRYKFKMHLIDVR